jgi:carboxypeptidase family protein
MLLRQLHLSRKCNRLEPFVDSEERYPMKVWCRFFATVFALLLLACALLFVGRSVSAAADGKITGTVKLEGTAPHQKPIDMSKEPLCAKIHADKPVTLENVVVGPNGGLANVVVYISEGLTGNEANAVPSETPTWDQKGCQYIPHVMALDVNQHFKVTNSDQTSHNIHPMPKPGGPNHEWNKSQPAGAPPFDVAWTGEEVAVPVKCNIHPWMHGYMAVVKGPTAASDMNGAYVLNNVPAGSYTLTAWQETYGTQTQKVTVAAGKPATADFTFKAK